MTVREIRNHIDLQGEVQYVEYDYSTGTYYILDIFDAIDRRIKYMYCEDNALTVELEKDED
jgi:hypothetical protein